MDDISQSVFGRNEERPEKTLIWGPNSLESFIFVRHDPTAWEPCRTARHIWVSKNADGVSASGLAPVSAATWRCWVWSWGALPCWRLWHIFSGACLCVCQMKAAFHNATITPWSVWQLCTEHTRHFILFLTCGWRRWSQHFARQAGRRAGCDILCS